MDEKTRVALTPREAHLLLGGNAVLSRQSFYNGIHRGEIPAKRIGKRFIIPRYAFEKWLSDAGLTPPAGQPAQGEARV